MQLATIRPALRLLMLVVVAFLVSAAVAPSVLPNIGMRRVPRFVASSILLPFASLHVAEAKLLRAAVLHRHGARSSAGIVNGTIRYHAPYGVLTRFGEAQSIAMGAFVRRRYGSGGSGQGETDLGIGSSYEEAGLVSKSTSVERVILSGQFFLEGLFPDNGANGAGGGNNTAAIRAAVARGRADAAAVPTRSSPHVSSFSFPANDGDNVLLSPWNAIPAYTIEDRGAALQRRMDRLARSVVTERELEHSRRLLGLADGACDRRASGAYFCLELLQDVVMANLSLPIASPIASGSAQHSTGWRSSKGNGPPNRSHEGSVVGFQPAHARGYQADSVVSAMLPRLRYLQAVYVNSLIGYGLRWDPKADGAALCEQTDGESIKKESDGAVETQKASDSKSTAVMPMAMKGCPLALARLAVPRTESGGLRGGPIAHFPALSFAPPLTRSDENAGAPFNLDMHNNGAADAAARAADSEAMLRTSPRNYALSSDVMVGGGGEAFLRSVGSAGYPFVSEVLDFFRIDSEGAAGMDVGNGDSLLANASHFAAGPATGGKAPPSPLLASSPLCRLRHYSAHDYTLTAAYGALGVVMHDAFDDGASVPRFGDAMLLELHSDEGEEGGTSTMKHARRSRAAALTKGAMGSRLTVRAFLARPSQEAPPCAEDAGRGSNASASSPSLSKAASLRCANGDAFAEANSIAIAVTPLRLMGIRRRREGSSSALVSSDDSADGSLDLSELLAFVEMRSPRVSNSSAALLCATDGGAVAMHDGASNTKSNNDTCTRRAPSHTSSYAMVQPVGHCYASKGSLLRVNCTVGALAASSSSSSFSFAPSPQCAFYHERCPLVPLPCADDGAECESECQRDNTVEEAKGESSTLAEGRSSDNGWGSAVLYEGAVSFAKTLALVALLSAVAAAVFYEARQRRRRAAYTPLP